MSEPPPAVPRLAFVYILKCADGSLYTGWTYDLAARLQRHNAGTGARYTRARLPVEMVYSENLATQQAARRREYQLKQLNRAEKLALIAAFQSSTG